MTIPMRAVLLAATLAVGSGTVACDDDVSTADEVALGRDYAHEVESEVPPVADPEIDRYLTMLGTSIAAPADERHLAWSFRLVNVSEPNAFAIPGGFVYVTRGLVERTDSMSQFAGVLGHEIAHVTRRHSVQQMQTQQRVTGAVLVTCVITGRCLSLAERLGLRVGGELLFARHSREDEAQADDDAVNNVVRAGIDPRGIPQFFAILKDERERSPDAVEAWFSTHPTDEDRIARTNRDIEAVGAARLSTLRSDSPDFHDFKARVHALSPAKQVSSESTP